jgi:hypothetical protein
MQYLNRDHAAEKEAIVLLIREAVGCMRLMP